MFKQSPVTQLAKLCVDWIASSFCTAPNMSAPQEF